MEKFSFLIESVYNQNVKEKLKIFLHAVLSNLPNPQKLKNIETYYTDFKEY